MNFKQITKIILTCCLIVLITACAHKRNPNRAGVVDGNGGYGRDGAETYGQGMGGNGNGAGGDYCQSSKCRPGKPVPHAEQHYFFDFDSNDVRSDAVESIQLQANYLAKHPNAKVRLEGNTDDVGSSEYNVALGERRARSVLDVLRQYGVSASQITVVSFGAEKPAAGGDDEKSHQCNRRVDLKYID